MKEAMIISENTMPLQVFEQLQESRAILLNSYEMAAASEKSIRIYPAIKRAIDFTIALFGLIISTPLWLVIVIAVKLNSRGPILYFQERYGKDGRKFRQWKFRSMIHDAEKKTGPVLASEEDPRITSVGWILRKTAMDELPQLINILVGEMSFVGPRPERPYLVDNQILDKVPNFHERHVIRPGLTGLAQVYGRYNTSPRDKLRYDLLYVENYNLFLDVKMFFLSIWITLHAKWQVRGKKL
jgi:lipopolysaccharide/colanic/teichoic acid biosynthesis glycosyltransferase